MSEYLIDGIRVSKEHPLYQQSLETAYAEKSRPTCLCKESGVPMYIAKLSPSEYLIKRMPNTGKNHGIDCESYEIPSELSGRGDLDDKAVLEDQETGLTNLKLDFSLSKITSSRSGSMAASEGATTVSASPKKLSILSLLHFIYEEAALNKWSPRMAGKRNWYIVRKHLLEAAANKVSRRNKISDFLFIPEVFQVDRKDEIEARRKQFMNKLTVKDGKQPMGILIGELKAIESARFGHKLVIKHLPGTPFYLNDGLYKRISKVFDQELAFFHENEGIHLLVVSTFLLSSSGNPSVDTISLMTVDRNWLPFENIHEMELNERLSADRHFIKGMRYNLKKKDVIASALLTDTDEPTAIYIQPDQEDEPYIEQMNSVIESTELNSVVWDVNSGQVLQLPPAAEKKTKWTNNNANS